MTCLLLLRINLEEFLHSHPPPGLFAYRAKYPNHRGEADVPSFADSQERRTRHPASPFDRGGANTFGFEKALQFRRRLKLVHRSHGRQKRVFRSKWLSIRKRGEDGMRQNFSEEVGEVGRLIRAVRVARGFTQQEVAKGAGVSRAQLADFEKGANVSILFLMKIASFLKFPVLSYDAGALTSAPGLDVSRILHLLKVVNTAVDELNVALVDALLPPSERSGELRDTPALRAFLEKHRADERVAAALVGGTDDKPISREPKAARQLAAGTRRTTRKAGA